jgi:glycosyltransferase involved in cell wall biosynthesis
VKDRHEGLRLVLAGDEPGDHLRASAADLVAGGALTFAGCVPDADLPDLYRAATLFVLPSRQEGLGISVAEAMASGVPVVATRCGGPESLVEDGRTGRLVANGDEAALAEAVDALLSDAPARRAMGAAARAAAEARFSRAAVEPVLDAAFRDTFGPTLFPER